MRRASVIYYFLKACVRFRVFPVRYFCVHLDYVDERSKIYSKQKINEAIPLQWRLKSILLPHEDSLEHWEKKIGEHFSFPLFLKPEWGENSYGVHRVHDTQTLSTVLQKIKQTKQNYTCQQAATGANEYDFFYIKSSQKQKEPNVFSCTRMKSPHIIGDGESPLYELLQKQSPLLRLNTGILSHYQPTDVLAKGKSLRLSFINGVNHGTTYIDETKNIHPQEKTKIWKHLSQLGNFQFARIGISADSLQDIIKGRFEVIEINLFTPLPLDILDQNREKKEQKKQLEQYMNSLIKSVKIQNKKNASLFKVVELLWRKKQILMRHK